MKKIVLTILLLLLTPAIVFAGGWKFYVFGVDLDRLKDKKWVEVMIGAVLSVAVHEAAHVAYLKLNGKDHWVDRQGFRLFVHRSQELTLQEGRRFGRAGFAAQLTIGSLLSSYAEDSAFTAGWLGVTNYQLAYYGTDPVGDFRSIDANGGDGEKEYQAFSLWVNLLGDRHAIQGRL